MSATLTSLESCLDRVAERHRELTDARYSQWFTPSPTDAAALATALTNLAADVRLAEAACAAWQSAGAPSGPPPSSVRLTTTRLVLGIAGAFLASFLLHQCGSPR